MNGPKISVVMPTYNRGDKIRASVDSVLSQSWPLVELIIIDDASTDDTWAVIESYKSSHPNIVAVRQATNQGGGKARNTGIDLATGAYVALLDSDDFWSADKLEKQIATLRLSGGGENIVIYNRVCMLIGTHERHSPSYAWDASYPIEDYMVPEMQSMQSSGLLFSTSFGQKVRFDDNLRKHQDIDFVMKLDRAGGKFVLCAENTVFYVNTTYSDRVSMNPKPELTLTLLNKWKGAISSRTRGYYIATTVAPMYWRSNRLKSLSYLLGSLPWSIRYAHRVFEGFILWNFPESTYSKIRQLFRKVTGRTAR